MVIRKRTIFAGFTNYQGATLDDIVAEIVHFKKIAEETIKNLNNLKVKISDVLSARIVKEINGFIDSRIDDYSCYIDDFGRLIRELPRQVTKAHCEILRQITADIKRQKRRCGDFKNNLDEASNDQEVKIIDRVYEEAKQLTIDFFDVDNLKTTLLTFIGVNVKPSRKASKQKSISSDGMSEIDRSTWRLPQETYLVRIQLKHGDYKFCIRWHGSEPKDLKFRKTSQMDSLFNVFIANKDSPIHQNEIRRFLETKQPPNRAIRDLNDALVNRLRRKFPREYIPDLIIGYSKKKDGYISLIPIIDESILNTLDKEDDILEKSTREFLPGSRIMKRGKK